MPDIGRRVLNLESTPASFRLQDFYLLDLGLPALNSG